MIAANLVPELWPAIHPPRSDEEAASLHSANSDCQLSHSQGAVILVFTASNSYINEIVFLS